MVCHFFTTRLHSPAWDPVYCGRRYFVGVVVPHTLLQVLLASAWMPQSGGVAPNDFMTATPSGIIPANLLSIGMFKMWWARFSPFTFASYSSICIAKSTTLLQVFLAATRSVIIPPTASTAQHGIQYVVSVILSAYTSESSPSF